MGTFRYYVESRVWWWAGFLFRKSDIGSGCYEVFVGGRWEVSSLEVLIGATKCEPMREVTLDELTELIANKLRSMSSNQRDYWMSVV